MKLPQVTQLINAGADIQCSQLYARALAPSLQCCECWEPWCLGCEGRMGEKGTEELPNPERQGIELDEEMGTLCLESFVTSRSTMLASPWSPESLCQRSGVLQVKGGQWGRRREGGGAEREGPASPRPTNLQCNLLR